MAKRTAPERTNRLIPYVRQSQARPGETRDDALSLDAQEARIRDWGERREYRVLPAIRDHDLTGADPARPGIAELQAIAGPGDLVAVYMWDRFARDILLQETIVRQLAARGVEVVSITEASDPFSRQIRGVISEHFSRQLSQRVGDALAERHGRGFHHGRTPWGYDRPPIAELHGRVIARGDLAPDPAAAPHVVALFTQAANGASYNELTRWLIDTVPAPRGGVWRTNTVREIIRNPVYAGGVRMHGEVVWDGHHPPIVDRVTWERAQRAVITQTRRRQRLHWAEGLVRHVCGHPMICQPLHRPGVKAYLFYACSHRNKPGPIRCASPRTSIGADKVTWSIRRCLIADLATALSPAAALAHLDAAANDPAAADTRTRLLRERVRFETRLLRARELWLAGHDPLAAYEAERTAIRQQLERIERELAALPVALDPALLAQGAGLLADLGAILATLDPDELRPILRELGLAEVTDSGVRIRYAEPYNHLIPTPTTILAPRRLRTGELL